MSVLRYIPLQSIRAVRESQASETAKTELLAGIFRLNTLYMIAKARSGHIGTCFSCLDLVSLLWLQEMQAPNSPEGDIFFSSKGHDAPALYSVMLGLEQLPFEKIHTLRSIEGLPGHPDVGTPGIATNTGSLGMGVSKARGMAQAKRLQGRKGRVFVITGDGELQEGQFWESLLPAANGKFSEINVFVDHNKLQSDTYVQNVSDLGDLEARLRSHGWEVARCDGHDLQALRQVLDKFSTITDRPKICIADTVKGKGVSFMSQVAETEYGPMYKYHSGAPTAEEYDRALKELQSFIENKARALGLEQPAYAETTLPETPAATAIQKLIPAYGQELLELGGLREDLAVLDGDLALDCGLLPFAKAYPKRFYECGIAEQDMVSFAGGLALQGVLPVVHSFACFLTPRPNEHIYNNATEHTKIIYAGSLAGLLPGKPGHSHQSMRDIGLLGSVPGLTMIQPADESETRLALRWAVQENPGSTYIRLVTIPCEIPFALPEDHALQRGKGSVLRQGEDALLFAYGPVMLAQAWKCAELLGEQGVALKVVNMPWLNTVDIEWLRQTLGSTRRVVFVDDHFVHGGQGQFLAAQLASIDLDGLRSLCLGVADIPRCGDNEDVLKAHGLDACSMAAAIRNFI